MIKTDPFYPRGEILHDSDPYIRFYNPENSSVLGSNYFVTRNRLMKLCVRSISFRYNQQRSDNYMTIFSGVKEFFEINTRLFYHRLKEHKVQPLSTFGRKKPGIFLYAHNLYYLTHRFMRFRNLLVKLRRCQYHDISFFRQLRPLNRRLFFTLFEKLTKFSFKLPVWIMYNFKRKHVLRIFYLGFAIFLRNHPLRQFLSRRSRQYQPQHKQKIRYRRQTRNHYRLYRKFKYLLYRKLKYPARHKSKIHFAIAGSKKLRRKKKKGLKKQRLRYPHSRPRLRVLKQKGLKKNTVRGFTRLRLLKLSQYKKPNFKHRLLWRYMTTINYQRRYKYQLSQKNSRWFMRGKKKYIVKRKRANK